MPDAAFFANLGLYLQENFFDQELCRQVREEMLSSEHFQAYTLHYDGDVVVDDHFRNCRQANLTKSTKAQVKAKFAEVKSELESHFHVALSGYEKPSYLLYRAGEFFGPHMDQHRPASQLEREDEHFAARRKVSVVLFLNDYSHEPSPITFSGGELTFFGLIKDPRWVDFGFPLHAKEGLLVAFASDVWHEVKSVENGERYTIVSWYY